MIDKLKQYLPGKVVEEGRKITKPQDLVRLYDIIIQVSLIFSGNISFKIDIVIYKLNI